LELLAHIARLQLMKAAEGAPSKKPSVALALPAMKTLLESGNEDDRVFTAQAATYMGPLAAPLVPQLLALVRSPTNSSPSALEALIGIGPAASNALPLICRLATNTDLKCRVVAVRGLEALGPTATAAMPLLTSLLLQETGPGWRSGPPEPDPVRAAMTQAGFSPRFMIARAMARVGAVPDEAVPVLLAMKQGTNWWERWAAALALWRREPGDPELKAQIIQSLHASNGFAVQLSLGGLGTNAAAFVPEIRRLADAPGPDGSAARRTLHAISHPAR
jgi:HEAT repeat protein